MRSLVRYVLDFVDSAKRSPASASSPEWLNSLEAAAFEDLDGAFFALNAAVAVYTWEVRTIMQGDVLQTDRIPFNFPYPVEVLGFRSVCAAIPGQSATLIDPASITGLATDVVDVQIDVDKSTFISFAEGISTPGGPNNSNFVTLSAIDIQAPRLFALKLTAPRPQIGFIYQWSLGIATPFADCLVKTSIYVRQYGGYGGNRGNTIGE